MKRTLSIATVTGLAVVGMSLSGSAYAKPGTNEAPLHVATSRAVADQYIVVLKGGADGATVAQRHGAKTRYVYDSALHGFSAKLDAKQLKQIRNDAQVAYVDQDATVSVNDKPGTETTQTPATWGLDRVDQRVLPLNNAFRYSSTGSGVTAYVIDTGINTSHNDFGGRASAGFTAINDGNGTNDCHGHGTHVSGTIGGATYGVAKAVKLKAVRVLDCSGSGTWEGVIAGVDWVTNVHSGPSIANMSLGGGYVQAANDAITNSIGEGVSYALAAGNSNDDSCNYSPSSTPLALTVAATDSSDTRASFSNWGSCVDVFGPGVNITSDWIGSNTATAVLSGTSMASPHVAGLAALYLQNNPYATQLSVNAAITQTASFGVVTDPAGSPNALARKWTGNLSGTGSVAYQPDGSYWFQSNAGYIRAWLRGSSGTNTDLFLQRWNGSAWVTIVSATTASNVEKFVYNAAGSTYYRLQIKATSGGGAFDTWATHPA